MNNKVYVTKPLSPDSPVNDLVAAGYRRVGAGLALPYVISRVDRPDWRSADRLVWLTEHTYRRDLSRDRLAVSEDKWRAIPNSASGALTGYVDVVVLSDGLMLRCGIWRIEQAERDAQKSLTDAGYFSGLRLQRKNRALRGYKPNVCERDKPAVQRAENASLREALGKAEKRGLHDLERIADLEHANEMLRKDLNRALAERDAARDHSKGEVDDAREAHAADIARFCRDFARLRDERNRARYDAGRMYKQREDYAAAVVRLRKALAEARAECDEARTSAALLRSDNVKFADEITRLRIALDARKPRPLF